MRRDLLIGPAENLRAVLVLRDGGMTLGEAARAIYPDVYGWTCHAKPAATGKTCGHVNAAGIHHNGNLCCERCGCTKVASDAREKT